MHCSPWARPGAILTSHLAACTAQFPPREKLTSWYLLLPHYLVPPPCFSIFTPFIFFSIERRLPFKFPGTTPFQSLAPAKGFLSYLVTYLAALFWLSIEQCCPSSMPLPSYPLLDFFYRARSTTRMPWPRHLSSPVPRLFVLLVFLPVVFLLLVVSIIFLFSYLFLSYNHQEKSLPCKSPGPGTSPFQSLGPSEDTAHF